MFVVKRGTTESNLLICTIFIIILTIYPKYIMILKIWRHVMILILKKKCLFIKEFTSKTKKRFRIKSLSLFGQMKVDLWLSGSELTPPEESHPPRLKKTLFGSVFLISAQFLPKHTDPHSRWARTKVFSAAL